MKTRQVQSLILILVADTMNPSLGTPFAGVVLPGLLLAGLYLIYFLVLSMMWSTTVPAVPPLGLVIAVLGSMARSLPSIWTVA